MALACWTAFTTSPATMVVWAWPFSQPLHLFLPVPASPFVLIMAAPSEILLRASPKFLAPQTKGIVKERLSTWFSLSAGLNTAKCETDSRAKLQHLNVITFRFVNHVHTYCLEDLSFDKVTDAALGKYGDGHGGNDVFN